MGEHPLYPFLVEPYLAEMNLPVYLRENLKFQCLGLPLQPHRSTYTPIALHPPATPYLITCDRRSLLPILLVPPRCFSMAPFSSLGALLNHRMSLHISTSSSMWIDNNKVVPRSRECRMSKYNNGVTTRVGNTTMDHQRGATAQALLHWLLAWLGIIGAVVSFPDAW